MRTTGLNDDGLGKWTKGMDVVAESARRIADTAYTKWLNHDKLENDSGSIHFQGNWEDPDISKGQQWCIDHIHSLSETISHNLIDD